MAGLTAIVAGATGLVGGECLERLLGEPRYSRVVALARREPVGTKHRKLEVVIADFDRLDSVRDALRDSRLAADLLELEITENVFVGDADAVRLTLHALNRLGVHTGLEA